MDRFPIRGILGNIKDIEYKLKCILAGFHEIGYFRIFRQSTNKIQVSLKSEKVNVYFT